MGDAMTMPSQACAFGNSFVGELGIVFYYKDNWRGGLGRLGPGGHLARCWPCLGCPLGLGF